MVGHLKDGYEGYNSTPSSPTKYTVNRPQRVDGNGKWIVSRLCIFLTAFFFVLSIITVFLVTYYLLSKKCVVENCDKHYSASIQNGHGSKTNKNDTQSAIQSIFPLNCSVNQLQINKPTGFNLTNDVMDIDVEPDDENKDFVINTDVISTTTEKAVSNQSLHRLPRNVIPTRYRLKFIPFMDENNLTTYGEINITIRCLEETNQIRLNLKDITIEDKDVYVYSNFLNKSLMIKNIQTFETYEQIEINLESYLKISEEYTLSIKYSGKIRNGSNGFYRSSYVDAETKQKRYIYNTLFSPTYARFAYPSFDEPSFKARFLISLGRPLEMMTFSNMNVSHSEPIQGMDTWVWDHYHETPLMPTYLTAFLIAPITALMQNKVDRSQSPEIKVWARPERISQTQLPSVFAERILTYFEKYFNVSYPLSKMDIIGVPSHAYNAMENWGLIIFKEDILLIDEENSVKMQHSLATTLGHELAHQWFGNLVTPTWWDDIWLKEGLSTYFQCLAINYIKPDWLVFERFILDEMNKAFQEDSLLMSPPISKNITVPSHEIFNAIIYYKSSAIVRMMANFIHSKTFKVGLTSYLNKYKYSNANQDDLWNSLISEEGFRYNNDKFTNLKSIMDTWILQPGFPVINVLKTNGTIKIMQERFLYNLNTTNEQVWWVPISYTNGNERKFNETAPKVWLPGEKEITIEDPSSANHWVLMNLRTTGFFRVNYDLENWMMLIGNFSSLPHWTRAQLISDSLYLAQALKLPYDMAFAVTNSLSTENDYLPWEAAIPPLKHLRNSLIKMPVYGNFKKYLFAIIMRAYHSTLGDPNDFIPWKISDDPIPQMFTEKIIDIACLVGYPYCISDSLKLFEVWSGSNDETNPIPEMVRPIVYCTAIKNGPAKYWEFIYKKFHNTPNKTVKQKVERTNLIKSLGCASEQWLLTRSLGLIMKHDSGLDIDDGAELFKSVAYNNIGHWLAMSFVRDQWKRIIEYYETSSLVHEMINSIVLYINSPYDVTLLKNLVNEIRNYTEEDSLMLKKAIETAENNIIWMENSYGPITIWMDYFIQNSPFAQNL